MKVKVKKVMLAFMVFSLSLTSFSCATVNKRIKIDQQAEERKYYYNLGKKDGYKVGLELGQAEERNRILHNLKMWEKDVLSLNAGMELVKRGILPKGVLYREKMGKKVIRLVMEYPSVSLQKTDEILKQDIFIPLRNDFSVAKTLHNEAPMPNINFITNPLGRLFYRKGFKEGYEAGYSEGVAKERVRAEKQLKIFERKILATEYSKYMLINLYITYPRVYRRISDDGNYIEIEVIPPKVEGVRKIQDIITGRWISKVYQPVTEKENRVFVGDILLPKTTENMIDKTGELKDENLFFVKVSTPEPLFKLNVPFVKRDDTYFAVFFDRAQMQDFCRTYKVCENNTGK